MSRVVMVAHSYFPADPRVRKAAQALARRGNAVTVMCLSSPGEARAATEGPVTVRRFPVERRRSRGKAGYLLEYLRFFLLAAAALARAEFAQHIDVVYVHNLPDELVFAALVPKWRGAAVVLDLHDPMPELFADKYGVGEGTVKRVLEHLEMVSCRFAHHLVVSSEPCRRRLVSRGIERGRVTVVENLPDGRLYTRARGEPFVLMYHGSVFDRYGLDTVLRGLALLGEERSRVQLHVFASDVDARCLARLEALASELGLEETVAFSGRIAPLTVGHMLRHADAGIVPARRSGHMDIVYSTKLFEYLAAGLPVLAASTPALEELGIGGRVRFYRPGDARDLCDGLLALLAEAPVPMAATAAVLPHGLQGQEMGERSAAAVRAALAAATQDGDLVCEESGT